MNHEFTGKDIEQMRDAAKNDIRHSFTSDKAERSESSKVDQRSAPKLPAND